MQEKEILLANAELELAEGLDEGHALNIANSAAKLFGGMMSCQRAGVREDRRDSID